MTATRAEIARRRHGADRGILLGQVESGQGTHIGIAGEECNQFNAVSDSVKGVTTARTISLTAQAILTELLPALLRPGLLRLVARCSTRDAPAPIASL